MCTLSRARRDIKIDIYYQVFERGLRVRSAAVDAPRRLLLLNFQAEVTASPCCFPG
jgi:hypothetical protein